MHLEFRLKGQFLQNLNFPLSVHPAESGTPELAKSVEDGRESPKKLEYDLLQRPSKGHFETYSNTSKSEIRQLS